MEMKLDLLNTICDGALRNKSLGCLLTYYWNSFTAGDKSLEHQCQTANKRRDTAFSRQNEPNFKTSLKTHQHGTDERKMFMIGLSVAENGLKPALISLINTSHCSRHTAAAYELASLLLI